MRFQAVRRSDVGVHLESFCRVVELGVELDHATAQLLQLGPGFLGRPHVALVGLLHALPRDTQVPHHLLHRTESVGCRARVEKRHLWGTARQDSREGTWAQRNFGGEGAQKTPCPETRRR